MNTFLLEQAARKVKELFPNARPKCALILGTGWGDCVTAFQIKQSVSYATIPCLGRPTVDGHQGHLFLANVAGLELFVFQGRRHWYEGEGWEPVACPIFLSLRFNASVVVLTSASGGIRSDLKPGDIMIVEDHINAMGANPLIGSHEPIWGTRFPDQTHVYDRHLMRLLEEAASKTDEKLSRGNYIATSGPAYETPSEIRAFRAMGAHAVGMSTVPEAMLAHSAGLRVAAMSCIANAAADADRPGLSHDDILIQARRNQPRMTALLNAFIKGLASHVFHDEQ